MPAWLQGCAAALVAAQVRKGGRLTQLHGGLPLSRAGMIHSNKLEVHVVSGEEVI